MAHRRTIDAVDVYDIQMQRLMSRALDQVRVRLLAITRTRAN
ncbi:hypothetical protein [Sphingomonas sp. LR55]|jgi:hypothetical protein